MAFLQSKRQLVTGFIIFILCSFLTTNVFAKDELIGHYAEQEIRALIELEIMEGDSSGKFLPERDITRAEFVKLIIEGLGVEGTGADVTFEDIRSDEWFYEYAIIAAQHGIVEGDGSANFVPNRTITREEMAVMIKRALDTAGVTLKPESLPFVDQHKISDWAIDDIKQLVSADIIKGELKNDQLYFSPKTEAPRGQAAAFIYRTLHTIDPETYPELKPIPTHKETKYPYTFDYMVDAQVKSTPKVDGAGKYTASKALVEYYANPSNFGKDTAEYYQFLILSEPAGTVASELNKQFLNGKGTLDKQGKAFIEAANKENINELYLITHALHETGNGTSSLAKGIKVGKDKNGKLQLVTDKNKKDLTSIKTTYNMFGIKAVDSCAKECGAKHAYEEGWFTPHDAIVGGAVFIGEGYIHFEDPNGKYSSLDTLYKMRWNPEGKITPNVWSKQYATHVQWATTQGRKLAEMYDKISTYRARFDIPVYSGHPGVTSLPKPEDHYAVLPSSVAKAWTTAKDTKLNVRKGPTTNFEIVTTLSYRTEVKVLGKNGSWYKIQSGSHEGWVSGDYISSEKPDKKKDVKADAALNEDVVVNIEADVSFGQTVTDTPFYDESDRSGEAEVTLPAETEVAILGTVDDMYEVEVDEVKGFILQSDVERINN
ncbi:MAG TPA: S-layer homology domain-containing protein [Bacillota bacterium]|nr:S-layer homology domain-containing protein [Bacillota bacterium]